MSLGSMQIMNPHIPLRMGKTGLTPDKNANSKLDINRLYGFLR